MTDVTIPKNRLTIMWIVIVVFVLLLLFLFLRTPRTIDPNVLNFQRLLEEGTFNGAALIGEDGTVKIFNQKLAEQASCGQIGKDKKIPENCKEGIKDEVPKINTATLLVFPSTNYHKATVLAIVGDPTVYNLKHCDDPNGAAC